MSVAGEERPAALSAPQEERVLAAMVVDVGSRAQELELFRAVVLPVSVQVVDMLRPEH